MIDTMATESAATSIYPFLPPGAKVLSISELNAIVKQNLEERYSSVWVEGEISNFKVHQASGHAYFSLKDEGSILRAIMYRGQIGKLPVGFEPKDGLEVVACGFLSIYLQRGDYQIQVQRMYPKGLGQAQQALQQLKEKLGRLGYFDVRRKKKLPLFPRCIGLIASPTGAAVRDLIEILGRRWPSAKVFVRPSRVQGDGAVEEIASAIAQINRWRQQRHCWTDVIILARGGGSSEDLGAFNQEAVAKAIFESSIPIVSAVGHEVDVTIADLVADVRAATPSHAAQLVVPDRQEYVGLIDAQRDRIGLAQQQRLRLLQRRLEELAQRRALREPLEPIRERERRLDERSDRLNRAVQVLLSRERELLDATAARLESLSPLNVLARGYSLTTRQSTGELLRSSEQTLPGDRIETRLSAGRLVSRVEHVEPMSENS